MKLRYSSLISNSVSKYVGKKKLNFFNDIQLLNLRWQYRKTSLDTVYWRIIRVLFDANIIIEIEPFVGPQEFFSVRVSKSISPFSRLLYVNPSWVFVDWVFGFTFGCIWLDRSTIKFGRTIRSIKSDGLVFHLGRERFMPAGSLLLRYFDNKQQTFTVPR